MYKRLTDYIKGFIYVELTGLEPERFFNICRHRNIILWEISCTDDIYLFYVHVNAFKRLKEISRKSNVKIKIKEKHGLPFFLNKNRHRKAYVLGLSVSLAIIYILSLFIWNIEISGNIGYSDDTLRTKLAEINIVCGIKKSSISCENIEEYIRNECDDISWVSAQILGTKLKIKVKEAITTVTLPKDDKIYNIVASKEGTVTGIIVRSGMAAVSPGDKVSAGDTLIDGHILVYDDNQEISGEYNVSADGDISGIGIYTVTKSYPYLHRAAAYTGKKIKGVYINIPGYGLLFMLPKFSDYHMIYNKNSYQMRLVDNFFIPVYITYISGKEYNDYEELYSKKKMENLAKETNKIYYEKLLEKGVQIIENNVKIQCNEHSWNVICSFTVEEELGVREEIKTVDERN